MVNVDIVQEQKLIEAVRNHRVLYDKRVDGYHKGKDLIWKQIADQLGYEDITGNDWQLIWKNLRNQYMAHRRKLKKPSGSGTGKRPYYRHEASMGFINDTLGEEETYSNLNILANEDGEGTTTDSASKTSECEVPATNTSMDSDHRVHAKFTGKKKLDAFDESLLNILQGDEKDEFSTFGDLMSLKLRKIAEKDARLAATTQQSINATIFQAEMELL